MVRRWCGDVMWWCLMWWMSRIGINTCILLRWGWQTLFSSYALPLAFAGSSWGPPSTPASPYVPREESGSSLHSTFYFIIVKKITVGYPGKIRGGVYLLQRETDADWREWVPWLHLLEAWWRNSAVKGKAQQLPSSALSSEPPSSAQFFGRFRNLCNFMLYFHNSTVHLEHESL